MCGIAGVINFDESAVNPERLNRMSEAMVNRGPDDNGSYIKNNIAILHRRLSVLDLSSAGHQPMCNSSESIQIVFNGEIYNYKSLKLELESIGYVFKSSSDTEVIIYGYEAWGKDVVLHLDGMFAFALWDVNKETLFIARDRVGEKPLYFSKNNNSFVFASSLIALHEYFGSELEIDEIGIDCYFSHGFIPSPNTIWKSIKSFPHAHAAIINKNGDMKVERYWDFPDLPPEKLSVEEAEKKIIDALEKSISQRLVADVPVGGFLSGGVDSSLVMAIAIKLRKNIDTFSLGFKESEYSELPYARQVSEAIGSNHHEIILSADDVLDILPELIWQLGQPFADPSIVPTFLVSKFSRKKVTVSLSGDGGDESFAGYWRYSAAWYAGVYSKLIPEGIRKNIIPALFGKLKSNIARRIVAMNELSLLSDGSAYTNSESWFNYRKEIIGDKFHSFLDKHNPVSYRTGRKWSGKNTSVLRQMAFDDFQVLLPDAYLNKVDIASMGSSLEVRTPFLCHHFLEQAWLLNDDLKLRWGKQKWLLKRIAAKYVPKSVIYRKKMGFAMPMKMWWRGKLGNVLEVLMADSRAAKYGWMRDETVKSALKDHLSGIADHEVRLWSALCFELWVRIVVEGSMKRNASLRDYLK